ncbi:glycosyltransferase family 1 protein [Vandammella animalimorsus]|uniref:glycosyltransferase family 4 protein n=1 Tax=Vandammella animalimorsus TaxID=2029117 RepID=UPI0031B9C4A3
MIYLNVSNSHRTRAKTGIQRVVRELSRRLAGPDCRLIVIQGAQLYDISEQLDAFLLAQAFEPSTALPLEQLQPGDLFFDIDASWGDLYDYHSMMRAIKQQGCIMLRMHYDAVPVLHPRFSHPDTVYRYSENLAEGLLLFDHWVCISQTVKRDLLQLAQDLGAGIFEPQVFDLGSDIPTSPPAQSDAAASLQRIPPGRFALAVGTIEPRKNYELVLAAYDALVQDPEFSDVGLVLVGKSGWNNDALVQAIQNHPRYGKQLLWLKDASDVELDALYRAASLCLCLSHYEGYGLPAVEALARQLPVICTQGSAMQEAAQGQATAVALQPQAVCQAMKTLLLHRPEIHFKPISWDDSAEQMRQILARLRPAPPEPIHIRQAVYISIRKDSLLRSIDSLAHAPFITQVVVLTSDAMQPTLKALFQDHRLDVRIHTESEIGLTALPEDHQERNTLLRRQLYQQDFIDPHFLAFDDDYVVLHPIGPEVFVQQDDRQRAHFYEEDGKHWLGALPRPTSFDAGLWRTVAFLDGCAYPRRLYNAHQPQLIDKALASQILQRTQAYRLDEWSSYFNIACHLRPWAFTPVRYATAGWPANFDSWLCPAPEALHFYNDPPEDQDWEQAAKQWHEQLQQANASWDAYPRLILRDGQLGFHPAQINLQRHPRVFVPILSDQPIDALSYHFQAEDRAFTWPNIPNFLIAPGHCRVNNPYTITARITSGGKALEAQLHVMTQT